jgi:hypothetical protein
MRLIIATAFVLPMVALFAYADPCAEYVNPPAKYKLRKDDPRWGKSIPLTLAEGRIVLGEMDYTVPDMELKQKNGKTYHYKLLVSTRASPGVSTIQTSLLSSKGSGQQFKYNFIRKNGHIKSYWSVPYTGACNLTDS